MSRRTSLLLVFAACALASGLALVLRSLPEKETEAEPVVQILRKDPARIERMVLESRGASTTLYRSGDSWRVEYPHPIRLWEVSVNNLLYAFSRLDAVRLLSSGPYDRADYGLDPPAARATAILAGGERLTLLLGAKSPSDNTWFLEVEGEGKLYTVSRNIADYLRYSLPDFRVRSVNPVDLEQLEYLFLRRGDLVMETRLKKGGELDRFALTYGRYLMSRPYKALRGLSSEKFPGLLLELDELSIGEFVDDAPADLGAYGLDRPWGELVARDGRSGMHLQFGARTGNGLVYFKEAGSPAVYALDESRVEFLRAFQPFEYVDKYVFVPELKDLSRIEVTTPAGTRVLAVSRATVEGPPAPDSTGVLERFTADDREVSPEGFKSAFLAIAGLFAEGNVSRIASGPPELSIRFELLEGEPVRVDYLPYDRSFLAVSRDGVAEFALSREQVRRMLSALEALQ
jgi:hypothetical protein